MVAAMAIAVPLNGQRYLSEIFTDVDRTNDVTYAVNITIITGTPAPDTLMCDIYEPQGDTMSARPVVIVSHTGSFLPVPLNGQATGNRKDSAVVWTCQQLAKRGFVAVAMSNRLGWLPTGNQEERTGTLLNAAYRGIQDARTCARFFRDNANNGGNTWGVDVNRIALGGFGTGGYIAFGAAYLDSYDEINLAKFINPNTLMSYVDTSLSGDVEGKWNRPLNIGNYPNESSEFAICVNMGGACGDSTWAEFGETPMVSFHVPNDPFAPFKFGPVIVPTTGDFVVNVSGSHDMQRITNGLGMNTEYSNAIYSDPYTTEADLRNDGHDGLFAFYRPTPESGPWEFWDTTVWNIPHPSGGTFNSQGMLTNPDMSMMKALNYIDTVLNYAVPRIVCAMNLPGCISTSVEDPLASEVSVYPNPSANMFNIRSEMGSNLIESVELIDLSGKLLFKAEGIDAMDFRLDHTGAATGIYMLKVYTTNGVTTKKVMFE